MATTLIKTIRAQVRRGMLEPLEHIDLPEGQPLNITLTVTTALPKKKPHLTVWHLGQLKGQLTRDEIYGDLI